MTLRIAFILHWGSDMKRTLAAIVVVVVVAGCQEASPSNPTGTAKVVQDNSEPIDTVLVEQDFTANQVSAETEYLNKSRRYNAYVLGVAKDKSGKVFLKVMSIHDPQVIVAYLKDPSQAAKLSPPVTVVFRAVCQYKDGRVSFRDVQSVKVDKTVEQARE